MDSTSTMNPLDGASLAESFDRHRARLRRMVEIRLDQRVRACIDPSDVVQEAFVEIARRVAARQLDPGISEFLWFRLIVGERIAKTHRRHLGTQRRDRCREMSLAGRSWPAASSATMAVQLVSREESPSAAAQREDRLQRLEAALEMLEPIDREILSMRYFEDLDRAETAAMLGITEAAAAKRYGRALRRLRAALSSMSGGLEAL